MIASRTLRTLAGMLPPLLLLFAWQMAVADGALDLTIWASPGSVARALWTSVGDAAMLADLEASLRRDLCGVLLGSLAGIGAGLLLGLSPLLNRLLLPLLTAVRQVALFLWIPFLSIWVGDGETAKIAFVGLAAFFPVMLNTERGIASVDRGLMEVADLLRLPYHVRLWRILLPQAVPSIAAGLRLALIYGWLATIGSEYLFLSGAGIGTAMITARQLLQMDQVIVGIVAIAAIGFLQHVAAGWIETRLLAWRDDR